MKSMAVRVTLLCLFIVASGAAAYLTWTAESRARRESDASRRFEYAAFAVARDVIDLRAAQQAYVAAGQGEDFWISRTAASTVAIRAALDALRAQAAASEAQASVDNATSELDDFEQMDRRARDYTRSGQKLLASDLIFTDGIENTGAIVASIERARAAEVRARDASSAAERRTEWVALAGAAGIGLLAALLLTPRGQAPAREDVSERIEHAPAPAGTLSFRPPLDAAPARLIETPPPPAPIDLSGVASLCSDLARVVDTRALPGLLGRAASVLDAPGIVLWIADPDGRELSPIVTHGYSQQMVLRLGTILRDDENATASAFRTSLMQTVDTDAVSNGAIAAPLVTPAGCVGVMAAEVRNKGEQDAAKLAAATIVAAQLATLVGPPSTRAQARADAM